MHLDILLALNSLRCNLQPFIPLRCKLSEEMFAACQALKTHLSDATALSSRELVCSVIQRESPWKVTVCAYVHVCVCARLMVCHWMGVERC